MLRSTFAHKVAHVIHNLGKLRRGLEGKDDPRQSLDGRESEVGELIEMKLFGGVAITQGQDLLLMVRTGWDVEKGGYIADPYLIPLEELGRSMAEGCPWEIRLEGKDPEKSSVRVRCVSSFSEIIFFFLIFREDHVTSDTLHTNYNPSYRQHPYSFQWKLLPTKSKRLSISPRPTMENPPSTQKW
jgi:hypothetical protein